MDTPSGRGKPRGLHGGGWGEGQQGRTSNARMLPAPGEPTESLQVTRRRRASRQSRTMGQQPGRNQRGREPEHAHVCDSARGGSHTPGQAQPMSPTGSSRNSQPMRKRHPSRQSRIPHMRDGEGPQHVGGPRHAAEGGADFRPHRWGAISQVKHRTPDGYTGGGREPPTRHEPMNAAESPDAQRVLPTHRAGSTAERAAAPLRLPAERPAKPELYRQQPLPRIRSSTQRPGTREWPARKQAGERRGRSHGA